MLQKTIRKVRCEDHNALYSFCKNNMTYLFTFVKKTKRNFFGKEVKYVEMSFSHDLDFETVLKFSYNPFMCFLVRVKYKIIDHFKKD